MIDHQRIKEVNLCKFSEYLAGYKIGAEELKNLS